jgi:acyl carrier protein
MDLVSSTALAKSFLLVSASLLEQSVAKYHCSVSPSGFPLSVCKPMSEVILAGVIDIMAGLFGLSPEALTLDSSMETIGQWDSLQHINVIVDVEQRFGIALSPEEVVQLHSVRAIVDIVQAKLASQS